MTANEQKLKVVDPSATIKRYACTGCGVHMHGRINNKKHALYGIDFIHTELSTERLGAAGVRGVRLVDHRVGHGAGRHGRVAHASKSSTLSRTMPCRRR